MRKHKPKKRILALDPKFSDAAVTKFINFMMYDGKKSTAATTFYDAIDIVSKKTAENGIDVWKRALANVSPRVEVKSRRVGGSTYQVPTEVRPERSVAVGYRWLLSYTRKRNEKSMAEKLAGEIIAASKGEGSSVKKREDTYRMAEANKAYSHFRF